MSPAQIRFEVDGRFAADRSVVLRYAPALLRGWLATEELLPWSRREGTRVLDLGRWRGVGLQLLDESSGMASGTHKSLDGCLSTALCRKHAIRRAVFSSGANAGSALSLYGAGSGLESFFFCPAANLGKLDGALFESPCTHLIAVEGSDRRVKEAARLASARLGAPLIPDLDWRMLAAGCRGLFIAEQILQNGQGFGWVAQSVCAGYGPLGIYRAFAGLVDSGSFDRARVPRFLGVQQAGLCPVVRAWEQRRRTLPPLAAADWQEAPIEPALYNVHPEETYPLLCEALATWGGDMVTISQGEFDHYGKEFLARVEGAGLRLTRTVIGGREQIAERAGLLAGAGALKAIAEGRVEQGDAVLCALTGGAGPAPSKPAVPQLRIGLADNLDQAVLALVRHLGES